MSQQLLTISQLARYVGVTVRTVRHYHALGLLPEPPRDSSGYRRYGAEAVITLTRIKILADAGVPLAQIESLMQASAAHFATAIGSIKADISKRIKELEATKRRLDALHAGDRMFVSEAVVDYLAALKRIGLSETMISHERSAWILISALYPDHVDTWASQKKTILASPDIASLYRRLDEARSWPADDPRIERFAEDMIRLARNYRAEPLAGKDRLAADKLALSLIDQHGAEAFPSLKRLRETIDRLTRT